MQPITITPVNGRAPTLCFGLAWDQAKLDPAVAALRRGLDPSRMPAIKKQPEFANALLRTPGDSSDLDALVFYFGDGAKLKGYLGGVYDMALDGALAHSGDDRSGHGEGWDELVVINLEMVPPDVSALALVVDVSSGPRLDKVKGLRSQLFYAQSGQALLTFEARPEPESSTLLLGIIRRTPEGFVVSPAQAFMATDTSAALETWWREYL